MSSILTRIKQIVRIKLWSRQQINGKNSDSFYPIAMAFMFFVLFILLTLAVVIPAITSILSLGSLDTISQILGFILMPLVSIAIIMGGIACYVVVKEI